MIGKIILLSLLGCCISHSAGLADNPYMDDAAYQQASSELPAKRIEPAIVAKSNFPTWGVLIHDVKPDGDAAKQGMKPGFVIGEVNGKEYYSNKLKFITKGGQMVMTGTSAEGEKQTFTFGIGTLGISYFDYHLDEQYLYQNITHGKWDKDMLVTSVAWQFGDHTLATAALARALKAGMPENKFSLYYRTQILLDRGDVKSARLYTDDLLKQLPKDRTQISRFFHPGLRTIALATQDFSLLKDVCKEMDGLSQDMGDSYYVELCKNPSQQSLQSWVTWAGNKPRPSLYPTAQAKAGSNVMSDIKTDSGPWNYKPSENADNIRSGTLGMYPLPDYYYYYSFKPKDPIKDVIWSFRLAISDLLAPTIKDRNMGVVTFALLDREGFSDAATRDPQDRKNRFVASIAFVHEATRVRYALLSGGPTGEDIPCALDTPLLTNSERDQLPKSNYTKKSVLTDKSKTVQVTLIRIGNEAEILLDGRSIFHVPVDPKVQDLSFMVRTEGETTMLENMTLRPILPFPSAEKN